MWCALLKKFFILVFIIVSFVFIFCLTNLFASNTVSSAELYIQKFGILTLLPTLTAIVLCFITRNVILSLSVGVFCGTCMLEINSNIFKTLLKGFVLFVLKIRGSLASSWNAGVILQCLTIGGLVALISRSGGLYSIAEQLAKKAKTVRSAQFVCWLLGLIIFFDDYANSLIVGPVMRPVTDKLKISREKLAFIVDATAAPVAAVALISTWIGYEVGLIKDAYLSIGQEVNPYIIFVSTIPYRFYNFLMLGFIIFTIIFLKEFGPMLAAEKRARTTGKVISDTAKPLMSDEILYLQPGLVCRGNVWNAIIPISTLIIVTILGFYYSGYKTILSGNNNELIQLIKTSPLSFAAIRETFGAADVSVVLFQSALVSSCVTMFIGITQKMFSFSEGLTCWINGMKSLLITCIILLLAWSLSSVVKELGSAKYLVSVLSNSIPKFLLPASIFLVSCIISFATGTSYGTMGILIPLSVPLAYSISSQREYVVICISAVLTGAIFGDHCSPISDTTILSSMGSACDHMDHTNTQLVYAVVVGIISFLFGYLPLGLGVPVTIVLPVSVFVTALTVYFIGKNVEQH